MKHPPGSFNAILAEPDPAAEEIARLMLMNAQLLEALVATEKYFEAFIPYRADDLHTGDCEAYELITQMRVAIKATTEMGSTQ